MRLHGIAPAGFLFALLPPSPGEGPALTFRAKATILEPADMARALGRIAHEIVERNRGAAEVSLVGVLTRGAHLAHRLAERIREIEGVDVPVGSLDIGMYRDDIALREPVPIAPTRLPAIDDRVVVLVDDVLYTGRSTRAALDALIDVGRPRTVQLAVLVDRGHRELPIRADYVGKNVPTARHEEVRVHVAEIDGEDAVVVGEHQPQEAAR